MSRCFFARKLSSFNGNILSFPTSLLILIQSMRRSEKKKKLSLKYGEKHLNGSREIWFNTHGNIEKTARVP